MNEIRVLLVGDMDSFRESTICYLKREKVSVEKFCGGEKLLAELPKFVSPIEQCCVVIDLRMSGMTGLDLMWELCQRRHRFPVVLMTGQGDVAMAVEAMRRGAMNVVEKPFCDEMFLETIKASVISPSSGLKDIPASMEKIKKLSPREKQVLGLVSAGKLNKTIADILGISIKTVELHRSNMLNKLGVKNVQDLVRLTLGYL